MYRLFGGIIVLAFLCSVGTLAADEVSNNAPDEPSLFASRILAVTDVVLQQHIDPPARQQMILTGVKALYLAGNRKVPRELSQHVSGLATHAEFAEYLDSVREEFSELENAETILTQMVLSVGPCFFKKYSSIGFS